jgi:acetophenone carboxylase
MRLDRELVQRYRLEPRSPWEEKTTDAIEAADFAVLSTKLELICEEGQQIMVKTGVSEAMQAGDCIVGVYTAAGDLSLACVGTCLHAATGQIPNKFILKYYWDDPTVMVREGDVFFTNEAQLGGIHNPDQINTIPVFWPGERGEPGEPQRLIAWVAAASHESETGATEPGGIPPSAKTRYDEGLKTPPLKVGENFALKGDVMAMIANMVRDHRLIEVDMKARTAACFKVRERLLSLIELTSADFVVGLLRRSCEAAAEGARKVAAEMLDGTFRSAMFFDNIGRDEGLGRVMVGVHKVADTITVDLSGCSPQTPSIINAPTHVVRAHMAAMLALYVMPDLPCSSGLYQPFEFIAPEEGTCLNPTMEAAISGGVGLAPVAVAGLHSCLNKMMFATALRPRVAVPFGTAARFFGYGGINQHGQLVAGLLASSINAIGGGARPTEDGVDSAGFWWSGWGDCLDIEHDEIQHPYLYSFRALAPDQAGPGKFRGGAGAANNVVIHGSPFYYAIVMGVCWRFPSAIGQFGGYAGSCCPALTVQDSNWQAAMAEPGFENPRSLPELAANRPVDGNYTLRTMAPGLAYFEGESIGVATVAGGGYGDVLERDPEAVMEDIRRSTASVWTAENVYCVVFNPDTLVVDRNATTERRKAERAARLARGKPYAEFVAEWEELSPPAEALKYYGSWPDAELEIDVPAAL